LLSFCSNDGDYFSRIGDVMRLVYVFMICLFTSVNLFAADLLPLTKDGFGGIKWGTEYSEELGMKECVDYGKSIVCTKENEDFKNISGVPVEVEYVFKGAYFSYVRIGFDGIQHWPTISNMLTKTYGESQPVAGMDEFIHNGFLYSNMVDGVEIGGGYAGKIKQILLVASSLVYAAEIEEAATNRLNKMALSMFTAAERKSLDGFLGAKWGMTAEQIPHKILRNIDKGSYAQVENLYFGTIPVDGISYTFKDNKLNSIIITFNFASNMPEEDAIVILKDILEINFGKFEWYARNSSYNLLLPKTSINIFKVDNGILVGASQVRN
jgi:hypothetical protein